MGTLEVKVERAAAKKVAGEKPLSWQQGHVQVNSAADCVRILLIAGGTGGHIFPVLAVAEELRQRSDSRGPVFEMMFLGTGRQLESRLIPAAGFNLRSVAAAGLKGIGGWRKLRNLFVLPKSAVETAMLLREFQPDVVVGVGGYLSGPAMLEAALRDIPTLLIEPNAVPGFTNRVLAPVVRMAAVGFEETAKLYGPKARLTGHAVRKAFSSLPAREHVPPFTVLILGGSQGSAAINRCVIEALPLVSNQVQPMTFIHQTGERDYNAVSKAYQERGLAAEVQAFIENVPGAFARADLIVSRAGATAVAELAAAGKAALVVPFPAATDQHQLENARALECAGAARVVRQVELTPQRLASEIEDLLGHPGRLVEMERKARGLARPDAAARIADMIEELAR